MTIGIKGAEKKKKSILRREREIYWVSSLQKASGISDMPICVIAL